MGLDPDEQAPSWETVIFFHISAIFKRNLVIIQEEIIKYVFFLEILVMSTLLPRSQMCPLSGKGSEIKKIEFLIIL